MGQGGERAAVRLEPGVVEAVAVDEAGTGGRVEAVMLLAVTAPKPRPIARRRMAVS
jgi:hypothetical protein